MSTAFDRMKGKMKLPGLRKKQSSMDNVTSLTSSSPNILVSSNSVFKPIIKKKPVYYGDDNTKESIHKILYSNKTK
jgi:hypothetical protein